ncbi:nitrate reductase [Synechocystis sp. PCC 6803]|uniref:Nitrate reductase n=1 Tax=Synechocystis sp. (strain ATCC 27184 / PCC 6803 / Kazusa) TaxID=1111708 RepID=NARB_SYNY3|nr:MULTISPECIES: nitrate reductase [unclassified Synechocystis]P73448.1 RecName: Full=Nitrate reductase [Synechocystis sp. PCC 6803 substr. Kazusa]AGF51177.1 nitrate reductase [Synechocystis sp. PCC 6803]ALJ67200.1 nitrate reductase [Synechocystis sp. PCC 6803]AVP89043.1 nitrate reductase catalytic subunit [Synechocystis sp. IPPAS B-1465]MBD2618401.1 nitrate reductase [Synechocystis sp. FACHB-898]MBD2640070.1 nitrate reductase [Synechocystis sp. FACHB-908]
MDSPAILPTTRTLCPYCGVGCGLEAVASPQKSVVDAGHAHKIRGDRQHPSSQGMVCVKGATVMESMDKQRLLYPMFRSSLDQPWQQISWEAALEIVVDKIQQVKQTLGVSGLCMYASGQMQTEDYYVAQKLFKGCLGTNNFDTNSRLCMSSAVSAYSLSFGSDGPPCCYEDLEITDCAFLIGTNTADCHPIIFNRLRKHHKQNPHVKLIVVDPRCTATAEVADLHLAINPGSDITLLHGIAYLLKKWNLIDQKFIDNHTQDFEQYCQVIDHYPPEKVTQICGISLEQLETAAHYWGNAKTVLSLWSMGMNQSFQGTAKGRCLINLHLLTGQIGKPGSGPFSLTGQPNAMGGREAGGLSHLLPGYRSIKNPQHRQEVEQLWQISPGRINPEPGLSAWEMFMGLENQQVGFLWIVATNPVVSMPDLERVKKALQQSTFTIHQDAYSPTETAEYAHLLLPAAQWSEKTGTMTNSERRVTLSPAFRSPPGEARPDWEIFAEVGRRLGFENQFNFVDSAAVHREYVQLTAERLCDQSGVSYEKLQKLGPLQWPCRQSDQESQLLSTKRLYTDYKFCTENGRANFCLDHSRGLAEPVDPNYPFVLTNGRLYGHWHTQTRTGHIEKIKKMHPKPILEMHPKDAEKLGIKSQDLVAIKSRRGSAQLEVLVTRAIAPGTVFMPMHWGFLWDDNAEVNSLTHATACPISKQPELKACAVNITPV